MTSAGGIGSPRRLAPTSGALGQRPRVSVVIACFNYGRFLEQCVTSALAQQGVDVDVTVIDDASTDGSLAAARELENDRGIRVVAHRTNAGYIASYNEVFAMVEGEYVVKLDADDALPPGALARSTSLLAAHPEVGFAYGRPFHFSGPAASPPTRALRRWEVWDGWDWLERRTRTARNCISNPEVTMRRSVLERVGPFDPLLRHTCDLALWMRFATQASVGRVVGPFQGCYRVHSASMQRTENAGVLVDLRGRLAAFDAALRGDESVAAQALCLQAHRAVAAQALDAACRAYDRGRVESREIKELLSLARDAYRNLEELPELRALERRQRLGPDRARTWPPFLTRALVRRASEELDALRWKRTGL